MSVLPDLGKNSLVLAYDDALPGRDRSWDLLGKLKLAICSEGSLRRVYLKKKIRFWGEVAGQLGLEKDSTGNHPYSPLRSAKKKVEGLTCLRGFGAKTGLSFIGTKSAGLGSLGKWVQSISRGKGTGGGQRNGEGHK